MAYQGIIREICQLLSPRPDGRIEGHDAFIRRVFNSALRMIVVGAVHITQVLAPMARIAGYDVFIVDPRRSWATADRFPDMTLIDEWPDDAMAELRPPTGAPP